MRHLQAAGGGALGTAAGAEKRRALASAGGRAPGGDRDGVELRGGEFSGDMRESGSARWGQGGLELRTQTGLDLMPAPLSFIYRPCGLGPRRISTEKATSRQEESVCDVGARRMVLQAESILEG